MGNDIVKRNIVNYLNQPKYQHNYETKIDTVKVIMNIKLMVSETFNYVFKISPF